MPKQTHNDVFTNSFMKTDFFKEQKELYLQNKAKIDEERRMKQEQKYNQENESTNSIPEIFKDNICFVKAASVSVEVIRICKDIMQKNEYIIYSPLCNQIVRSSTSVAANLSEGTCNCISYKDRSNKFSISYKECLETLYWLYALHEIGELEEEQYNRLADECMQIIKILSKSIYSMRSKTK